jgi:hypothetical protein
MSTEFYTIIGIEMVLLAFPAIGVFAMPLKLRSKTSTILLKTGICLLMILVWGVSIFSSELYSYFSFYMVTILALHILFLILSVYGVFSITKTMKNKWIKYLARFIVVAFVLFLYFIMTMVLIIGF